MKTDLNLRRAEVVPGDAINANPFNVRNYRLHQVLEQASRLLLFCIECDSNNTSSKVTPRDSRKILAQWQILKDEFDFSMEHNDFPSASHEKAYTVNILDPDEIELVRNVKIKRIVSEMYNSLMVMLSLDSANTQGSIAIEDADDIKAMFSLVDDCLARWIGSGENHESVGIQPPAYEILGEIVPDLTNSHSQTMEPSKTAPLPKLADSKDIPVAPKA